MAITYEEAVSLGMKIGEMFVEARVDTEEGLKIAMSLCTYAAVSSEMTEVTFLEYCITSFRKATARKREIQVEEGFQKEEQFTN